MVSNRLRGSASAYLRQHAENPVDWWPWGPEALDDAATHDRPLLVSIGYASCHWCHVMAHESFEDPELATFINDHFTPVKVDREERPDVDDYFMRACLAMNGNGGWPLTAFARPDGTVFFAGTYYPPTDRPGHVGFSSLLRAVRNAWRENRSALDEQTSTLANALATSDRASRGPAPATDPLEIVRAELRHRASPLGGLSRAPKFPRAGFLEAMLTGSSSDREVARQHLSLMARSGLYDHLEGGFARYCVDEQWHLPHFEKMLSDQALLVALYAKAARLLGEPDFSAVADDTISMVERCMSTPDGVATSLDADTVDGEGRHVTWTPEELARALDDDARTYWLHRFSLDEPPTEDGRWVPRLSPDTTLVLPATRLSERERLRSVRRARPQPSRDDMVVLEFNAMWICALLARASTDLDGRARALGAAILARHFDGSNWWRTSERRYLATSGDLAWTAEAFLRLFELSGEHQWIEAACNVSEYLFEHHATTSGPDGDLELALSSDLVNDVPVRTAPHYDGATPSPGAVALRVSAQLWLVTGERRWRTRADALDQSVRARASSDPLGTTDALLATEWLTRGVQLVVPGDAPEIVQHLRLRAVPYSVIVTGPGPNLLFNQREVGSLYLCRDGTCQLPVRTVADVDALLERLALV